MAGPSSDASCKPLNRFLAALAPDERAPLAPYLVPVEIHARERIYAPERSIGHLYFPETGALAILLVTREGHTTGIGTIGREGVAGIDALFGAAPRNHATIGQVTGRYLRLPVPMFRTVLRRSPALQILVFRYLEVLFSQAAQSVACSQFHTARQRYCRWLLATMDRVGPAFFLTQEFLAAILGVRRESVSQIASALQQAGLLDYARGRMHIRQRHELETCACECYAAVARQYAWLYREG